MTNSTSWSWALKHNRNESSTTRSPRAFGASMASPLRNTATHLSKAAPQSSCVISWPPGVNQAISRTSSPLRIGSPSKNRRRRNTGCLLRKVVTLRANASRSEFLSTNDQSIQDNSESWQYTLLLPFWVRPNSSPCVIIGVPWLTIRVAQKLRIWRERNSRTSGSSVAPSTPQFQDRLWLSPSRLSSPLASLCFWLYETRSLSVNPSWAVTKLMLAPGRRLVAS